MYIGILQSFGLQLGFQQCFRRRNKGNGLVTLIGRELFIFSSRPDNSRASPKAAFYFHLTRSRAPVSLIFLYDSSNAADFSFSLSSTSSVDLLAYRDPSVLVFSSDSSNVHHFVCLNIDKAFLPPIDFGAQGAIFFNISFPLVLTRGRLVQPGAAWSLSAISVGHALISTAFVLFCIAL